MGRDFVEEIQRRTRQGMTQRAQRAQTVRAQGPPRPPASQQRHGSARPAPASTSARQTVFHGQTQRPTPAKSQAKSPANRPHPGAKPAAAPLLTLLKLGFILLYALIAIGLWIHSKDFSFNKVLPASIVFFVLYSLLFGKKPKKI